MSVRIDRVDDTPRNGKATFNDLAICGGRPAFSEPQHVGRPNVVGKANILARIEQILDRAWLTNGGQVVAAFEQEVARLTGAAHCIAVSSGTIALQLVAQALGFHGQVIMPSLTFVATPHAVAWHGATPIFADVDEQTLTLDPEEVRRLGTELTTGVVGVHLWGQLCHVRELTAAADRLGVPLIFDASHALGCADESFRVGTCGRAETLSFHATKFINSAEGGAILTNDDDLASRVRAMKNFGFTAPGHVGMLGINGKLSEVAAAIGLTSLEHVDEIIAVNARNSQVYSHQFEAIPGFRQRVINPRGISNHQYVVFEVDTAKTVLTRDEIVATLRAENVLVRRYFYPGCHRVEPYCRNESPELPVTEAALDRVITMPTGLSISPEDIEHIANIVRVALARPHDVRKAIQANALSQSMTTRVSIPPLSRPYLTSLPIDAPSSSVD